MRSDAISPASGGSSCGTATSVVSGDGNGAIRRHAHRHGHFLRGSDRVEDRNATTKLAKGSDTITATYKDRD
jgi:hypothetical protein